MELTDIVFLLILFVFAGVVFYRAFRKKKWCPAVFGSDDTATRESDRK